MQTENERSTTASAMLADLTTLDLLELAPGENLWKLYSFRSWPSPDGVLEHLIYTKRNASGRLSLVTFARQGSASGACSRSGLARVADLSADDLERIVASIRRETVAGASCLEFDLSALGALQEQFDRLRKLAGQIVASDQAC